MNSKKLREVVAVIERHWSDWSINDTARHPKLILRRGSHHRTIFISKTPSDWRTLKNFERDLRRAIRELKEITA